MPTRPRSPRRRPGAQARGYDREHQQRTADAIAAEPWCHTQPCCPFPDAGTRANPLTGDHPLTLAQCGGDVEAWKAQKRVPLCRRCNSSKQARTRGEGRKFGVERPPQTRISLLLSLSEVRPPRTLTWGFGG
jgi:hypothetical protein